MSASGNASQLSQNIRDQFLQCKICLDGLKEPKTLPCLHTFCAECIICYAEHNLVDNCKFSCPICRRNIYIPRNGIEGFPDSFFVQSLNDVISQTSEPEVVSTGCGICKFKDSDSSAAVMCVDCKINLCEECSKKHASAAVTKDHTLLPLGGGSSANPTRDNFCRVHRGEVIKYYCETCNSPICLPCTFLEHQDHQVAEIKAVRLSFVEEMASLVVQSEDGAMQLQHAKDDLIELENELFVRRESIKTEIRKAIQELVKSVNDQEGKLLAEVDGYFDTVSVARDRQMIDRTIFRLNRAHDFVKLLLSEQTSPIVQLVNRGEAQDNLKQALAYELPDITRHANKLDKYMYFLPHQTSVNLGKLLQGNGSRQMATVTSVRHTLPSIKALYLHQIKSTEGSPLNEVIALGFLPNCGVVVLTLQQKKVKVFDNRGRLRYEFGDDDELLHPSDLVITKDGDIAVADCGYRCVKVYDRVGSFNLRFGSDQMFGLPIALTMDESGRYLVCDQAKERVTVHRQTGELIFEADTVALKSPQFIACHGERMFICDADNGVVAIYSYSRDEIQFVAKLTTDGVEFGQFLDFAGLCCDGKGDLLVADGILGRIHVFNENAEFSHIVTSGKRLLHPQCLAVSVDNYLAVAHKVPRLDETDESPFEILVYRLLKADA